LNPVAAGIAEVPETSEHTSIKERVEHVAAQGRTKDLKAARTTGVAGSEAAAGLEESLWLCPIEDRRALDSPREGMLEGFSLGSYLLLVDYTGRLFREGKAVISRQVAEIFERLGSSAETWQARLEKLRKGRLLGRFPPSAGLRLRGQPAAITRCGAASRSAPCAQSGGMRGDLTPARNLHTSRCARLPGDSLRRLGEQPVRRRWFLGEMQEYQAESPIVANWLAVRALPTDLAQPAGLTGRCDHAICLSHSFAAHGRLVVAPAYGDHSTG